MAVERDQEQEAVVLSKQEEERGRQMRIPTGEMGWTGLKESGGILYEEFLSQLMGERGRRVFLEMSENDPTVGAMLYAVEMMIRSAGIEVVPFSDDAEDEEPAEYIDSLFEDMSHTYQQFIGEWMAAPVYGWGFFEIVLKKRNGVAATPGKSSKFDDGRFGIRKLAIRHPTTLIRWILDPEGGVQAMEQRTKRGRATIPIEKALLFTIRSRKGSPEGTSLLRNAYVPYYYKKRIMELEAIGAENDYSGIPHFEVPPEWLLADPGSVHGQVIADLKKTGRRLKVNEQAVVITPTIFDNARNKVFDFKLVTTTGRRQFDTLKIRHGYALDILQSILADVIFLGHEQVGSFALASSKTDLFAMGVGAMLEGIDQTLNRHLVPRMLAINGMDVSRPPRYQHGDIESIDLEALGSFLLQRAQAGDVMFPSEDGELERELDRVSGLPAREIGEGPRQEVEEED